MPPAVLFYFLEELYSISGIVRDDDEFYVDFLVVRDVPLELHFMAFQFSGDRFDVLDEEASLPNP